MAEEKNKKNKVNTKKENNKKKNENVKKKEIEKKVSKVKKEEVKDKVSEEIEEIVEVKETEDKEVEKEKITEGGFLKKHLTDILLVGVVVILLIIGVLCMDSKEDNIESKLIELTYSEYSDLMASNEPFVFIVESANCGHCQTYMPIVEEFTEENDVTIYYIDLTTLSNDDYASLAQSNSFFIENANNWGTPTTMIITGNTVSDSLVGAVSEGDLEQFLIDNGIME